MQLARQCQFEFLLLICMISSMACDNNFVVSTYMFTVGPLLLYIVIQAEVDWAFTWIYMAYLLVAKWNCKAVVSLGLRLSQTWVPEHLQFLWPWVLRYLLWLSNYAVHCPMFMISLGIQCRAGQNDGFGLAGIENCTWCTVPHCNTLLDPQYWPHKTCCFYLSPKIWSAIYLCNEVYVQTQEQWL